MRELLERTTIKDIGYSVCILLLLISGMFLILGYNYEGLSTVFAFTSGLVVKIK